MTALGATRDNLIRQLVNLERRRSELKQAFGIQTRSQHKNFKARRGAQMKQNPELLHEYRATGESIRRIHEELRKLRDVEGLEEVA